MVLIRIEPSKCMCRSVLGISERKASVNRLGVVAIIKILCIEPECVNIGAFLWVFSLCWFVLYVCLFSFISKILLFTCFVVRVYE